MSSAVPQQASASAASQTQTQTQAPVRPGAELPPTLTLRGETRRVQREGIRWASDVIDNEGMGKKSSKGESFICSAVGRAGLRFSWAKNDATCWPGDASPFVRLPS